MKAESTMQLTNINIPTLCSYGFEVKASYLYKREPLLELSLKSMFLVAMNINLSEIKNGHKVQSKLFNTRFILI